LVGVKVSEVLVKHLLVGARLAIVAVLKYPQSGSIGLGQGNMGQSLVSDEGGIGYSLTLHIQEVDRCAGIIRGVEEVSLIEVLVGGIEVSVLVRSPKYQPLEGFLGRLSDDFKIVCALGPVSWLMRADLPLPHLPTVHGHF
jgi:hypothetical protein